MGTPSSWWLFQPTPSEKYAIVKMGENLPPTNRGEIFKKYLSCHHLWPKLLKNWGWFLPTLGNSLLWVYKPQQLPLMIPVNYP